MLIKASDLVVARSPLSLLPFSSHSSSSCVVYTLQLSPHIKLVQEIHFMAVIADEIDYAQPLASLLRTATAAAHESAEHSQGAGWLTRGELEKEEYVRFLMMLYHVYK